MFAAMTRRADTVFCRSRPGTSPRPGAPDIRVGGGTAAVSTAPSQPPPFTPVKASQTGLVQALQLAPRTAGPGISNKPAAHRPARGGARPDDGAACLPAASMEQRLMYTSRMLARHQVGALPGHPPHPHPRPRLPSSSETGYTSPLRKTAAVNAERKVQCPMQCRWEVTGPEPVVFKQRVPAPSLLPTARPRHLRP